jgi:Bifunctional DNA primase/polymerase, N-terminal
MNMHTNAHTVKADSATQIKSELYQAAMEYARKGVRVFPCQPDKTPHVGTGFYAATTDAGKIDKWWTRWPDALIGSSPHDQGLCVIDLDTAKPGFDDAALEALNLPATRKVQTPSGGRHLYFVGALDPSTGKLGPCIDTRGRLSYTILPAPGTGYTLTDARKPVSPPGGHRGAGGAPRRAACLQP